MIPCNRKPGPRDRDGHGWVTTMFGMVWHWRCHYCRKRSRSTERPDVTAPLPW